jgi:hypothetical protein
VHSAIQTSPIEQRLLPKNYRFERDRRDNNKIRAMSPTILLRIRTGNTWELRLETDGRIDAGTGVEPGKTISVFQIDTEHCAIAVIQVHPMPANPFAKRSGQ